MTHTNYTDLSSPNTYDGGTFERETAASDPNKKVGQPWPRGKGRSEKWH